MSLGKAIIAGTMMLSRLRRRRSVLGLPKVFPPTGAEPPPPEPEPDVKELIRAGADTLFYGILVLSRLATSSRRRRGFDVCVKAVVPGRSMANHGQ